MSPCSAPFATPTLALALPRPSLPRHPQSRCRRFAAAPPPRRRRPRVVRSCTACCPSVSHTGPSCVASAIDVEETGGVTSTTLQLFQLAPDTDYTFELSASNAAGESDRSAQTSITTDYFVPDPIGTINPCGSGASFSSCSATTITLSWEPPIARGLPITRYEVRFRYATSCTPTSPCTVSADNSIDISGTAGPSGPGQTLDIVCQRDSNGICASGVLSYSHGPLYQARAYQYSVRAWNGYGAHERARARHSARRAAMPTDAHRCPPTRGLAGCEGAVPPRHPPRRWHSVAPQNCLPPPARPSRASTSPPRCGARRQVAPT